VKYLKTGSAYYAPSAAAVEMVEAILKDKKKILPCAVYLQGEYGISGLLRRRAGASWARRALEQIIEIKLTPEEKAGLEKSAYALGLSFCITGCWEEKSRSPDTSDISFSLTSLRGGESSRTRTRPCPPSSSAARTPFPVACMSYS
jgi:hypothetical protein